MRLANVLVSVAATAMAAWIFMFASEVRARPLGSTPVATSHAAAGDEVRP